MVEIDLRIDFSDVENEDSFEPIPVGTYDFIVKSAESVIAKSGRPMIKWQLGIAHDGAERTIFYNSVLPHVVDGQMITSGVGMLVSVCKAVGQPWTGSSLNTEDYIGRAGRAEIIQKPKQVQNNEGDWVDDTSVPPVNDVKKFVY